MGWNWQKCNLLWLFSTVKLIFSESTGWISTIKISQVCFKFSESDSKDYGRLLTLLWSPNKSILSRTAEIEGDICGEHRKTRLKTLSQFFDYLQKLIKIL